MRGSSHWERAIRGRFGDRDVLTVDELRARYWPEVAIESVTEVIQFIEDEFGLPFGILRPEDPLDLLFVPVPTRNPFRWLRYQSRSGDIAAELTWQLRKRGVDRHTLLRSVDDMVRAWCWRPEDDPHRVD